MSNLFGNHVKRLRRARGLTQEALADRCGLSADTIRRLEHNSFSPSLITLEKLCTGLSLAVSTLFESLELGEHDAPRELIDLLSNRTPRELQLAYRVLRVFFDGIDGRPPPVPEDEIDDEPEDELDVLPFVDEPDTDDDDAE